MSHREPMTTRLYGGEEGQTLYPDHTYYRPNRHVKSTPLKDVWFVVQLGLLALLGYVIVVLVMT